MSQSGSYLSTYTVISKPATSAHEGTSLGEVARVFRINKLRFNEPLQAYGFRGLGVWGLGSRV